MNGDPTPISGTVLTTQQVRKVAALARLEVADAELEDYRAKLSSIMGYMDRLRGVDLEGVEPLAHIGDSANRLDEDTPRPGLPNEALMKMAPQHWEGFVKVPKVLDEGGGA